MQITSPAFSDGETIPREHTCDGPDTSPRLEWTGAPAGTVEFALVADDPDAPVGTWVHWVIYGLPATATGLPTGFPKTPTTADPVTAAQGSNDFRKVGYGGPCPPPGPAHRYYFTLYALDSPIGLSPGATKAQLVEAMQGHVVAEAQLMGRYSR